MNILVTGGCGYVGSKLIPLLLKNKHKVINIDTQWFGNYLIKHKNLINIKDDLANFEKHKIRNIDTVIHLASIANDPMAEIDKNLSWETSALNTMKLLEFLKKTKTKRIIYASSGSVYGIKKEKKVKENSKLEPISLYNKVKMVTERVLLSYKKNFEIFIIRPATVCGYSPRMRLDVTVNALTISALNKNIINVFGGSQIRPNIHIDDMCNLYIKFLKINKKNVGIYNAGFENSSIINVANYIKKVTGSKINVTNDKNDPRSYRLDSSKLLSIGFKPKKTYRDAVTELTKMYNSNLLKVSDKNYSLKWLKKILKKK
jgi:nucleoside-diphosphate-sugar epimerase